MKTRTTAEPKTHLMRTHLPQIIVGIFILVWAVLGLLGCLPAMMSPMLFDAPESISNVALIVFALGVVSFPIACVVSILMAGVSLCTQAIRRAYLWLLLPFASVLICAAAAVWIQFVQGEPFFG